jgi:hypothetical protein
MGRKKQRYGRWRGCHVQSFGICISLNAGKILGPEDYVESGELMAFLIRALPAEALAFAIAKYTVRFNGENEFSKLAWHSSS